MPRTPPRALENDWSYGMSNFNVGFIIFPNLTQLDFTAPLQVLARLPQSTTHIILSAFRRAAARP
jgi:hypothetical protein